MELAVVLVFKAKVVVKDVAKVEDMVEDEAKDFCFDCFVDKLEYSIKFTCVSK